jgi:hypothetical protein
MFVNSHCLFTYHVKLEQNSSHNSKNYGSPNRKLHKSLFISYLLLNIYFAATAGNGAAARATVSHSDSSIEKVKL